MIFEKGDRLICIEPDLGYSTQVRKYAFTKGKIYTITNIHRLSNEVVIQDDQGGYCDFHIRETIVNYGITYPFMDKHFIPQKIYRKDIIEDILK